MDIKNVKRLITIAIAVGSLNTTTAAPSVSVLRDTTVLTWNGRTSRVGIPEDVPLVITWDYPGSPIGTHTFVNVIKTSDDGTQELAAQLTPGEHVGPKGRLKWTPTVFGKRGGTYTVVVQWIKDSSNSYSKTGPIQLLGGAIKMTFPPNVTQTILRGNTIIVAWESTLPPESKIAIVIEPRGGQETGLQLIDTTADTGQYIWTVPANLEGPYSFQLLFVDKKDQLGGIGSNMGLILVR